MYYLSHLQGQKTSRIIIEADTTENVPGPDQPTGTLEKIFQHRVLC